MEKRNSVKLTALLVRYIVLCAVMGAVILLLFWQMLTMVMTSGFVLSANTAERQAKAACEAIEEAGSFDVALVPELCEYAFFDETGAVVQTSLSDKELRAAQSYRVTGVNSGGRYHKSAQLQSGVCVLQYTFGTQYRDKALRGKLPDAQLLFVGGFFLTVLLVLGGITLRTARRLKRSLQPLSDATNEMAQGNLTWRAASTGIVEYDDVLRAMQKLQTALGESLQAQWSMEHSRVAQMQALAHDLRTPLTVIDGNAQLLEETILTPEQTECVTAIVRAGGAAQDYVNSLRRIAGATGGINEGAAERCTDWLTPQTENPASEKKYDSVNAAAFLQELWHDAQEICKVYGVHLTKVQGREHEGEQEIANEGKLADTEQQACTCAKPQETLAMPQRFILQAQDVRRAVGNLVQNAVEHTPKGGSVALAFVWETPVLTVTVEDSGSGFSPQALLHAVQPLFTEHKGRTPQGHLGIGLAMAQRTAQNHSGVLRFENTQEGHARVTLAIGAAQGEATLSKNTVDYTS